MELINNSFNNSIAVKQDTLKSLGEKINQAGNLIINCLKNGHKVLSCGNGGSACDALHFTTELLNRFIKERPALPALALTADTATITAIANDYHYEQIFAKQISALGQTGDILFAISTSGNSSNIIKAVDEATKQGLQIIVLTGGTGGKLAQILTKNSIELRIPSHETPRIQEAHIVIIHALCALIDEAFT